MSSTTLASITVETAPREPDKLANIGRFQLRRLAESLGIIDNEQKKSAFMSGTPADMAQAVSAALRIMDGKSANGVAAQAPAQAAPTPTLALVPPPAQEAPVEDKPKRTPKTSAPAAAAPTGDVAELTRQVALNQGELVALNNQFKTLPSKERIDVLERQINGLIDMMQLNISLLLLLGEADPQINTSQYEVLKAGLEGKDDVLRMLRQAAKDSEGKE